MNSKSRAQQPTCAAIVVAAGSSSRMGGKVRKPYLTLRGKPILAWTLGALARVKNLRQIVLVTRPDDRPKALAAAKLARLPRRVKLDCADGGARRQDSVLNGLNATRADAELVLIHDAARPFPPQKAIEAACAQAAADGAAILACRVKDTVKREGVSLPSGAGTAHPRIEMTIPRAGLWLAQTPQVFRRALILKLFARLNASAPDLEVTDDASICEHFQHPVALIESSETNFKVTRPEDLQIAEAYLKLRLVR